MLEVDQAAPLFPPHVQEIIAFVRNVALVAIPFVLYYLSRYAQRKTATLNLIRTLETGSEIVDRLERLYLSRKFEEGAAAGLTQTPKDPYEGQAALIYFDFVMVLNFYESACAEIEENWVFDEILYTSTRNTIIGAREVLLARYSEKVGSDQSRHYPKLCKVAERWRRQADPDRLAAATHIPGD